ncbi:MAG: glycosyltransferase [Phycisphaerales bacterium]|nr:glycosyltransferase [Phycisphaerales bacterium]
MTADERPILILYASTGGGHKSAARGLEQAFEDCFADLNVAPHDALKQANPVFRMLYGGGYAAAIKVVPGIIGYLTDKTDAAPRNRRPRSSAPALMTLRLQRWIRRANPSIVIHTHFLTANIVGRLRARRQLDGKSVIVVTDFEAHRMWAQDADLYCVASARARDDLIACGAAAERVRVTGIPLRRQFREPPPVAAARRDLAIPRDQRVVLLLCVAYDRRTAGMIFDQLADIDGVSVVAIAGGDAVMQSHLQSRVRDPRHRVLGYTEEIGRWMRAADVVVSKPGGLTSSEALATETPMVIFNPIPGPELRNTEYLLENGAAIKVNRPETLGGRVRALLNDPERLAGMREAARRLGRPAAAEEIARATVALNRRETAESEAPGQPTVSPLY